MFLQCFAVPLKVITFDFLYNITEKVNAVYCGTVKTAELLKLSQTLNDKKLFQAYGHYFDLTIVNNDIDETIR